jgi:hypothetical protein
VLFVRSGGAGGKDIPANMSQQNGIVEYFKRLEMLHFRELVSYIRALEEHYGPGITDVIGGAKYELTYKQWTELAASEERNDIPALLRLQWQGAGPLLDYEVVYRDTGETRLRVARCFWADAFRELGAVDVGTALYCDDEYASATGFNRHIELTRTATLMEGSDCCDHCYTLEDWRED